MGVLARAEPTALDQLWLEHGGDATFTPARATQTGLVMVRGRAGGTGQRFNVGEMTVTRAAMTAATGHVGLAYVRGRDKRHAEMAARFDALLQDPQQRPNLLAKVIEPLAAAQARRRQQVETKAATTRVEFFTVARGE